MTTHIDCTTPEKLNHMIYNLEEAVVITRRIQTHGIKTAKDVRDALKVGMISQSQHDRLLKYTSIFIAQDALAEGRISQGQYDNCIAFNNEMQAECDKWGSD